jgi:hypothetical protein
MALVHRYSIIFKGDSEEHEKTAVGRQGAAVNLVTVKK